MPKLTARYITQKAAKAWMQATHRHLKPPRGDVFRIACVVDGALVGVVQVGRPSARMLNDGETCEVLRLATDGTPNVCSFLYGRAARAARELGFSRIVTYTLPAEGGASLRASGWVEDGVTDGGEWDRPSRPRAAAEQSEPKTRWAKAL